MAYGDRHESRRFGPGNGRDDRHGGNSGRNETRGIAHGKPWKETSPTSRILNIEFDNNTIRLLKIASVKRSETLYKTIRRACYNLIRNEVPQKEIDGLLGKRETVQKKPSARVWTPPVDEAPETSTWTPEEE